MFGKRFSRALAVTTVASLVMATAAFADTVENNVQADFGSENIAYTAGAPAVSVSFWIDATSSGGLPNCDASDGSSATVNFSIPSDV
jgi:hypothetical protein